MGSPVKVWRHRTGELVLDRTRVMGVLNVTPDSFSDGGRYFDPDAALRHGLDLIDAGADLVDVGGESTRPGSDPVSAEEEWRRGWPRRRSRSIRASASGRHWITICPSCVTWTKSWPSATRSSSACRGNPSSSDWEAVSRANDCRGASRRRPSRW